MLITKHITFFYIEKRFIYLNKIIDETNTYEHTTDIYIHTNNENLHESSLNAYNNGCIKIIYHDLSNSNPYYLTWKCRSLLQQQKDEYDVFMYIEDDILVPQKAIKYWLEYNTKLIEHNYNLGFIRIEIDEDDGTEYITDLPGMKFNTIINVDDELFCVNNINNYCAFWIYNKSEFNRFVDSKYYDIRNIPNFEIREASAFGLHGRGTNWYKETIIPISNNKLNENCRIYHLQNNYVIKKDNSFGSIKFDEAIKNDVFC